MAFDEHMNNKARGTYMRLCEYILELENFYAVLHFKIKQKKENDEEYIDEGQPMHIIFAKN